MAVFIAIAYIVLAGASVEPCAAKDIGPPPDPTPGPGSSGGSADCASQCSQYANSSNKYNECMSQCEDQGGSGLPYAASSASAAVPASVFY
jgi:hypothetical protein